LTNAPQINFQAPPTQATARYPLVVRPIGSKPASIATTVPVSTMPTAIFTDDKGNAAIYHADGSLVTKSHPANRDEPLVMYAAGLGATKGGRVTAGAPSPSSPLAVTGTVKVYFGNPQYKQSEMIVDWSGLVPGLIGVYQVSLRVPGFHSAGSALPVTIRVGGVLSPTTGPAPPVVAVN